MVQRNLNSEVQRDKFRFHVSVLICNRLNASSGEFNLCIGVSQRMVKKKAI